MSFAFDRNLTQRICTFGLVVVSTFALTQPASAAENPSPVVDQAATPPGWLPIDFGNAQISVPSSWSLISGGAEGCGQSMGVVLLGQGRWCPPGSGESAAPGTSIVTMSIIQSQTTAQGPHTLTNGIPVYAPGIAPVYLIPSLGARLTFTGPLPPGVLQTLTVSPRSVVLARGQASRVSPSWRWVSFGGIRFAVPSTWKVAQSANAPSCSTDIVLPAAGVTLARGPALPLPCALPEAEIRPVPQVGGIEIDEYKAPTPQPRACVGPRTIGSLHICIDAAPAYGVLVIQVSAKGVAAITVKLGMAGGGQIEKSVLHSFRRS
jgi:hypothetical protein